MKKNILILVACLLVQQASAQMYINDKSIRYQQERMVFKQWDRNKFSPTPGFLWLNPLYWLTWAFYPGYKDTDLRPLSASGPQTQRLALVAAMNATDKSYKLQADTLRTSAVSEIANQSGLVSSVDPLWLLYYSKELTPVLEHSEAELVASLPPAVRQQVVNEGIAAWYVRELDMLKERLEGAKTTTLDRGARILAYHRMLMEYRMLAATWATRTATAARNINSVAKQQQVRSNQVTIDAWTPESDAAIARKVLADRKY